MNLAEQNYHWSQALLTCLTSLGCNTFYIAPGSRNAPLSMACLRMAANSTTLHCHTHFDERSLAFAALGNAKALNQPTVVITTSGSAVANLLPAAVEAKQSGVPIIFLTADRPEELINCGANQAIEQIGIFSHFSTLTHNLPVPELKKWPEVLITLRNEINRSLELNVGPVHLNIPLKEPLYADTISEAFQPVEFPKLERTKQTTNPDYQFEAPILIIAGQLKTSEAKQVLKFSEKINAPIIADIGSQLKFQNDSHIIQHGHFLVQQPNARTLLSGITTVIQFGGRLVGKPLAQWLGSFAGKYIVIDQSAEPLDPTHKAEQYQLPARNWLSGLSVSGLQKQKPLTEQIIVFDNKLSNVLESLIPEEFSEITSIRLLSQLIPAEHSLMLGNSLSIRMFDQFSDTLTEPPEVFTNRGASGIDGLIATAAGISLADSRSVTAVIGDLSALYDMNSLYWLTRLQTSFVLIILNNDGGQIFSMLPSVKQKDVYQEAFLHAHGLNFENISRTFNLNYHCIESLQQLKDTYLHATTAQCATVLELKLPQGLLAEQSENIKQGLLEALNV